MPFVFNGATRTITEQALPGNPAIAEYDVLVDLWSAAENWWGTDDNQKYRFPFRLSGGGKRFVDGLGNQQYAPADIYLQNQEDMDWRIVPANYAHIVRLRAANLFAEDASLPLYRLTGLTASVIVEPSFSDIQTSYLVASGGGGGGGFTASDRALLQRLYALTGFQAGISVTAKAPTESAAGYRQTSDGLQQSWTLNPDGSETLNPET